MQEAEKKRKVMLYDILTDLAFLILKQKLLRMQLLSDGIGPWLVSSPDWSMRFVLCPWSGEILMLGKVVH